MKNKQSFLQAINTLLFSWGSDTPPEAIWAANELLDWVEYEFEISIKGRFEESEEQNADQNNQEVLTELNQIL